MSLRLCCSFAFGLVLGVSSLLGGNAKAGMLLFKSEVIALAGSSVGSTVFQSDTVVKFTGQFDSADTIVNVNNGSGSTPFISLQVEIDNMGPFDAVDPNAIGLISTTMAIFFNEPFYSQFPAIGIINFGAGGVGEGGYIAGFTSSTQPYAYDALSPNEFLGHGFSLTGFPNAMRIAFAGGAGNGTFFISEDDPITASISAVPEPTSMAIFGLGSLLFVARRVRRARSAV